MKQQRNKRRTYRKNEKDWKKDESMGLAKEKYNDPAWYLASGQLAKDVASLSFNNALGGPTTITAENGGSLSLNSYEFRAPGIMSIFTAPSFGVSTGGHSAINLASKNFYSWIRHANSGHSNYDAPDLMLYLGAMDSMYAIVAYLMRAYGVARVYSQVNRYVGDGLLKAMGLDPNDVRTNLAQLRGYINMYITKLSAFATPITMNMFKRHFWMFSGVYKDEPVAKSQMFMYVPAVLWKYVETDGVGKLEATTWASTFTTSAGLSMPIGSENTLATLYTKANAFMDAIVNSEDINIMSGDILKAYPNAIWTLNLIPEDYSTVPVYSEEVLDQIHNTDFAGVAPVSTLDMTTVPACSLERLNLFQDPSVGDGALLFMPQFKGGSNLAYASILDMHYEAPTPEQVLVASRNLMHANVSSTTAASGNVNIATLTTCGSDICLWANVYTTNETSNRFGVEITYNTPAANSNSTVKLEKLSAFNKYPRFYKMATTNLSSPVSGVFGEIDNYTLLSEDDVKRMHDTSLLSLLGVPFLGTAAK